MTGLRKGVAGVVLGAGLAGCAPGGEVTPSPSVGEGTTGVVTRTPSPSPTPQWDEEEQGAVDAVQRYLEVWSRIGQDLAEVDWNEIHDVADDPAVNNAIDTWNRWASKGWHLVGGPVFEPVSVSLGVHDVDGQVLHVRGCYVIEDAYVVDTAGDHLENSGAPRSVSRFDVLHNEPRYAVLEQFIEEGTC
ncbi:MAG: hypothetical protein LBI33_07255 [Propionibacteriaceae bacterium]|nr:hypothetical protein [Propionibacteriaceae bacterium]